MSSFYLQPSDRVRRWRRSAAARRPDVRLRDDQVVDDLLSVPDSRVCAVVISVDIYRADAAAVAETAAAGYQVARRVYLVTVDPHLDRAVILSGNARQFVAILYRVPSPGVQAKNSAEHRHVARIPQRDGLIGRILVVLRLR